MKELFKKKSILLLLTIILGLGISLGAVYFMYYKRDERLSNLITGLIKLDFQEKSNVIDLDNEVPVPDTVGILKSPYTFTVKNISQKTVNLNIKVDVKDNTNIPLGAVRYGVFINDKLVKKNYIHDDKILYTYEELLIDETIECKLRFWIDYYYDLPEKEFEALIQIEGESRDTGSEGITVTFDANGGSVDTTTKAVTVGENYGRLPIPVRDGYTFMGWNGKNMFNIKEIENGYTNDGNGNLVTCNNCYSTNYIEIKPNNNYTIQPRLSSGNWGAFYNENKEYVSGFGYYLSQTVVSPSNAKYIRFTISHINSNPIYSITTQLEEGDTATEYEPYYVTSDVKVTQTKNHTLKAIWKPNEYTVTFDANGGIITKKQCANEGETCTFNGEREVCYGANDSFSCKTAVNSINCSNSIFGDPVPGTPKICYLNANYNIIVVNNSAYGDLPTPVKTGYTFDGWYLESGFLYKISSSDIVTNNHTIYAKWIKN